MGEQSIAKSFKGILRIAHIKDIPEGNSNDDYFLNSTYYGEPKSLTDISGKDSKSDGSIGYANAVKALSGGVLRYSQYSNDKLRQNRVPVTDSMGNFLNWFVGFDGVTIGSNENINHYSEESTASFSFENYKGTKETINQKKYFPILKTNSLYIGLENKKLKQNKSSANYDTSVTLEDNPLLIIENKKDVNSNNNKTLRTIFQNSKDFSNDFDVIMYHQDDHIIDNKYHFAKADIVNLKSYIKDMIKKYSNSNIIEVPAGAVIWQYCSLETWNEGDYPMSIATNEITKTQNNLIQQASTKKNFDGDDLIPLYKRDYVLCDGSSITIPFYPKNFSNKNLMHHQDRFFRLFFNIGYKYTSKSDLLKRPKVIRNNNNDGRYYLLNNYNKAITSIPKLERLLQIDANYSSFTKNPPCQYSFDDAPIYINVDDDCYNNCDDLDVLFQEDLATMLCCNEIYNFVRSHEKTPSQNEIYTHLRGAKIPEEYIFNSYIGDDTTSMTSYINNSYSKDNVNEVIELKYYGSNDNGNTPILLLGREVNSYNSFIKFYDNNKKCYVHTRVYKLPLVTFFIQLITNPNTQLDIGLLPFLYSFYNFTFCVPSFISNDNTPSFIGSGAYMISDVNRKKQNTVQSWSSNYNDDIVPHRHWMFVSPVKTPENSHSDKEYYPLNVCFKTEGDQSDDNLCVSYEDNTKGCPHRAYQGGDIITEDSYVLGEAFIGQPENCTGDSHGWNKEVTDGSGSYIVREIPVRLSEMTIRNGIPVQIASHANHPQTLKKQWDSNGNLTYEAPPTLDDVEYRYGGYKCIVTDDKNGFKSVVPDKEQYDNGDILFFDYGAGIGEFNSSFVLGEEFYKYIPNTTTSYSHSMQIENFQDNDEVAAYDYLKRCFFTNVLYKKQYEMFNRMPPTFGECADRGNISTDTTKGKKYNLYEDDPRFVDLEPNRGLSSPPIKFGNEDVEIDDKKYTLNQNWGSSSNVFFSMENITMLPLIKL